jgi:ribosomal protein L3 glutamine methyltransferase
MRGTVASQHAGSSFVWVGVAQEFMQTVVWSSSLSQRKSFGTSATGTGTPSSPGSRNRGFGRLSKKTKGVINQPRFVYKMEKPSTGLASANLAGAHLRVPSNTKAVSLSYPPFDSANVESSYMHVIYTVADMHNRVSEWFESANLFYGHCTINGTEDSAFMILSVLDIPVIENISAHKQIVLTSEQKRKMLDLVHRRLSSRMPMAYLLRTAIQQGEMFVVNEHVLIPRSFIGEIIYDGSKHNEIVKHFMHANESVSKGNASATATNSVRRELKTALDMCTGCGALAILLAKRFPSLKHIDACDISAGALEIARKNVSAKKLGKRIFLHQGNLFEALNNNSRKYDLIICNPPYVRSRVVNAMPEEFKKEPKIALDGGADGLDVIDRFLKECVQFLEPHGMLILEIGDGQANFRKKHKYLAQFATYIETENMDSAGEVIALSAEVLMRAFGSEASNKEPISKDNETK